MKVRPLRGKCCSKR